MAKKQANTPPIESFAEDILAELYNAAHASYYAPDSGTTAYACKALLHSVLRHSYQMLQNCDIPALDPSTPPTDEDYAQIRAMQMGQDFGDDSHDVSEETR